MFMSTDQADVPDFKLRFPAGRLEGPIVDALLLIQMALGGIGVMMGGFVLMAADGFAPSSIAIAVIPFLIAYLLNFLYE